MSAERRQEIEDEVIAEELAQTSSHHFSFDDRVHYHGRRGLYSQDRGAAGAAPRGQVCLIPLRPVLTRESKCRCRTSTSGRYLVNVQPPYLVFREEVKEGEGTQRCAVLE